MIRSLIKKYKGSRPRRSIYLICFEETLISWLFYRTGLKKFFSRKELLNVSLTKDHSEAMQLYGHDRVQWLTTCSDRAKLNLDGARVLEVGPGGLLICGLLLQAKGAEYYAADAFEGNVRSEIALKVYSEFLASPSMQNTPRSLAMTVDRLGYYSDTPAEALAERFEADFFDLIWSNGVLEHLYDWEAALSSMHKVLSPGGTMIHNIDFGAHDFWRNFSNPLEFLTIPNWLYNIAYPRFRGYTNRRRKNEFLNAARAAGFSLVETLDEELYPQEVLTIRESGSSRLAGMDDSCLLTQRLTFVLRKQ